VQMTMAAQMMWLRLNKKAAWLSITPLVLQ
jgi:hypothetical protein